MGLLHHWFFVCSFVLFFKTVYFIYLVLAARTFSSCSEQGLLCHCSVQASHCGGFSCWAAQVLRHRASVVSAHEL